MDNQSRTILARRILFILILVILFGLVIWTFFIRDAGKKNTGQTLTPDTAQQQPKTTDQGQTPAASSQQGAQTQTSQNTANPQSTSQPTKLADTGPGDTLAVFVAASVIGTVVHHLCRKRTSHQHNI